MGCVVTLWYYVMEALGIYADEACLFCHESDLNQGKERRLITPSFVQPNLHMDFLFHSAVEHSGRLPLRR